MVNKKEKRKVKKREKKRKENKQKKQVKNVTGKTDIYVAQKGKLKRKRGGKKKPSGEVAEKTVSEEKTDLYSHPLIEKNTKDEKKLRVSNRSFSSHTAMIFLILILISLILFLLAGYIYPATGEDIAGNRVFWAINDGKFDRGLFTQFYTSFIFTTCVFLLGFYVNSTFVRYGLDNWIIFSIGIFMMFLFGLGKIGELTFNHELFNTFKDLILPGALIIMAYASHKIFKDLKGMKYNGSQ